jgi:hypothetical protein
MSYLRFLSLLLVAGGCGAAGWFGSRAAHEGLLPSERNRARAALSTTARDAREPVLPPEAPQGNWMARVKSAAPGDYAALMEEIDTLFPKDSSGKKEAAQKWLLGMWIARDADAAGAYVMEKKDPLLCGQFAMMLARVAPEKVEAFSKGLLRSKYDLLAITFRSLAETDPRAFLKLKPEDAGAQWARHWPRTIRTLAADDPAAAAAVWTGYGMSGPASEEMLFSIVGSWLTRDPQGVRNWMEGLENAEHHRIAQHAWLCALAKKDPAAARRELAGMDLGAWLPGRYEGAADHPQDARLAILAALARDNPAAALAELERFKQTIKVPEPKESDDPFAAQNDPSNELRQAVMGAIAPRLPDDPAQLLAALRKLRQEASLPEDMQKSLAGLKMSDWNTETAFQTLPMLLRGGGNYDPLAESMRDSLVRQITREDPACSLDVYASLSTAGREELSFPFIRGIIDAHDPELTLRLATLVPPDRWSMSGANTLGGELGKTPEAAKAIIEALPLNSNYQEAHTDFTRVWARSDPQAAAQWVVSQPENSFAARGLAESWAVYDDGAASAWAAGLPEGPLRDGAAQGLVHAIASADPESAWQWAASMSNRYQAAKAYRDLARWWGNEAPPEFVDALTAAMEHADGSDREAALESLKKPPEERWVNP